jgi:hypothetical protein
MTQKRLRQLLDFQRYAENPRLMKLLDETKLRYISTDQEKLSDGEMELNAAGSAYAPKKKENSND